MSAVKLVTNNQQAEAELAVQNEIKALKERMKELRKGAPKPVSFSVVEFKHKKTGETMRGLNIHGISAKPIFVYGSQALKLVEVAESLKAFVEEQRANLSWK